MPKPSQIKRRPVPSNVSLAINNPILERIFAARGISDNTQLDYRLASMLKPTLQGLGAAKVGYLVPNRFEYGYGLSPEIVEVAANMQP